MHRRRACVLGMLFAAGSVAAAESEPVVVTATRIEQSGFDLPFSIDRVDTETIHERQPRVNLSESLVRVPGVVALDRRNYAQDLQISVRGFGARAGFGVRGVRLLADGIPITMPDGQGQPALFDLESAARLEVLRGPFATLYGNAAGGVIQLVSERGPSVPTLSGGLLAGSHGTTRTSLKFGGESGGLNYLGTLARFDTDGPRAHSAATRDTGAVRLRLNPDDATRVTLLLDSLHQPDTQDPLGLTRTQWEQNPRQAGTGAEAFNTRKRVAHTQLGVVWERRLSPEDRVALTAYGGQRDVRQFLAFAGAGASQSGGVVDLDRAFGGLGLRWTRRVRAAAQPYTLTLGTDYDDMREHRRGYVNNNGSAGDLRRDEDDRVYNIDQYAHLEWQPAPRWVLAAGVRQSRVAFEARDHYITGADNPDDSGRALYRQTRPALGALYRWREAVNLYASAGGGFETPTLAELAYRPDGSAGLNFALRPSTSRNLEAGVKAAPAPGVRVQAALFRSRVDDEIVPGPAPAPGRSTFVNAKRTQRHGAELSLDAALTRTTQLYLALTAVDARFEQHVNTAGTDLSGKRLPGVPRATLYGELTWRPHPGWTTALEARRIGAIAVDDANTDTAPAYTVAGWRLGFERRGADWRFQPYVRIDNLFDTAYAGSVIVNASGGAYFEPAPGRNYTIGLDARVALK
jgi:iron complex outermembrane receptor protein